MKEEVNSQRVTAERDLSLHGRQMKLYETHMKDERKDKELQRAQTKATLELLNAPARQL